MTTVTELKAIIDSLPPRCVMADVALDAGPDLLDEYARLHDRPWSGGWCHFCARPGLAGGE